MVIQTPRGTKDLYGQEMVAWHKMEEIIRRVCHDFCIGEIRTPIFEYTELFVRGVGETTDVVQKEMYTFIDKGERSVTLKPEGTAGVARSFIEHKMYGNLLPVKLYYMTPLFRYEKPQAGRMRQFHSFGIEFLGSYSATADVEVISVAFELLKRLGIKNTTLYINSLGCPQCRAVYNKLLKEFIGKNLDGLCGSCKERFEKNPLRVLDCKVSGCKEIISQAPSILDALDEECNEHFEKVQSLLTAMEIPFGIDPKIVRGLDYYTRTVFEFVCTDVGAQSTLCGGGRYDGLIEQCGGPKTGAVGFGMGLERILLALEKQGNSLCIDDKIDVYIGSIGERGHLKAQVLVYQLRSNGISAEGDTLDRSVKAQLKYADKIGAKYSIIIGDDEIEKNTVKIKNMETGEQREITLDFLVQYIKGE